MLAFKKLCEAYENLSATEKGAILKEKSESIISRLKLLPISNLNPVNVLAGFIIGSVVADGTINEKEYLVIYPALSRVFGYDFDFKSLKGLFRKNKEGKKAVTDYTEKMLRIMNTSDDGLKKDIITLCLCVVAVDGKVSLEEKRYIMRLCESVYENK